MRPKASVKFFSVRYGWIAEGDPIPASAMHEAINAGAAEYETKVAQPKPKKKKAQAKRNVKRHDTTELEHPIVESADGDDSVSPSSTSTFAFIP